MLINFTNNDNMLVYSNMLVDYAKNKIGRYKSRSGIEPGN